MIDWSLPSTITSTGVHHGYRVAPATTADIPEYIDPVSRTWFAMLDPGGYILPHIDAGPYHVRWHYPLEPAGYVWTNGETLESPTEPFTVTHWEPHAVWNPHDTPRVHLIVDLVELVDGVDHSASLQLFDLDVVPKEVAWV